MLSLAHFHLPFFHTLNLDFFNDLLNKIKQNYQKESIFTQHLYVLSVRLPLNF